MTQLSLGFTRNKSPKSFLGSREAAFLLTLFALLNVLVLARIGHVTEQTRLAELSAADLPDGDGLESAPLETRGARLFSDLGCSACHGAEVEPRLAPELTGLLGRVEKLQGGGSVVIDEAYLRESILAPEAKKVAGYDTAMPGYADLLDERQLEALIAYLKGL